MEAAESIIMNLAKELRIEQVQSNERFEGVKSAVNELIVQDFNRLVLLLYRIDIPESKLKKALREQAGTDAADIITKMLIERQVQKIRSREAPKPSRSNIPDEDRW